MRSAEFVAGPSHRDTPVYFQAGQGCVEDKGWERWRDATTHILARVQILTACFVVVYLLTSSFIPFNCSRARFTARKEYVLSYKLKNNNSLFSYPSFHNLRIIYSLVLIFIFLVLIFPNTSKLYRTLQQKGKKKKTNGKRK